jgi:hypothetical protein
MKKDYWHHPAILPLKDVGMGALRKSGSHVGHNGATFCRQESGVGIGGWRGFGPNHIFCFPVTLCEDDGGREREGGRPRPGAENPRWRGCLYCTTALPFLLLTFFYACEYGSWAADIYIDGGGRLGRPTREIHGIRRLSVWHSRPGRKQAAICYSLLPAWREMRERSTR